MLCSCNAQPQPPTKINLFEAGKGDYAFYRIPGIVVTVKGTVLAYCEARLDNRSDWSTMDVVMRRSTDGGKSWSEPYVVSGVEGPKEENPAAVAADYGKPYGPSYNNPVAIADLAVLPDGSILCFYERGNEVSGDPLYNWLTVSGFTLDWLTAGKDSFDSR